jgi:threonine/homoserine/homoserine lactone efflux protein
MFWATLASTGLSVVLASDAHALAALKILGGLYLLYLAWRSARSALTTKPFTPDGSDGGRVRLRGLWLRGLLLHLTNPKAIMTWLAIMSLGVRNGAGTSTILAIVVGCAGLDGVVFGSYALVFSTKPMVRLHARARRGIEATLALFFGYAGLRLLLTRA